MEKCYSSEKNVQILIALMKKHGVKRVVVSPGTTNVCFVGSLQGDPYFELYSSVDERSAAYIACGLAAETKEPVALSCTGATASRNYIPGLTEAYYRKLPILAITGTQHQGRIGSYTPQVIDRTQQLKDMIVYSAQAMIPSTSEDEWVLNVELNRAFIALRKNGGGPVHINLMTNYNKDFNIKDLPPTRIIQHFSYHDALPKLKRGRIGIYVGSHTAWSPDLVNVVESFCAIYGAVVFCEHISNYKGLYRVSPGLLFQQEQYVASCRYIDIEIFIGSINGASIGIDAREVWRINPDGEIRDKSHRTTKVFQMEEVDFFKAYVHAAKSGVSMYASEDMEMSGISVEDTLLKSHVSEMCDSTPITEKVTASCGDTDSSVMFNSEGADSDMSFLKLCCLECERVTSKIPELPFSNAWIAQQTSRNLPEGCVLHLGILNTVRTWNFFDVPDSVLCYANTGGFGIDGDISSLVGASLAHSEKLYFGVVGDLAFFYDMNVLGNRHFGSNVRLMLINNGRGTEFRNYRHPAARFGEDADPYMAAAGHFGQQSRELVRHYAEDLGFEYLTADSKESYLENVSRFITPEMTDRPMLFEVFTDSKNESEVLKILYNLETNTTGAAKKLLKGVLGEKGTTVLKELLRY